jgi:hypothetical protein
LPSALDLERGSLLRFRTEFPIKIAILPLVVNNFFVGVEVDEVAADLVDIALERELIDLQEVLALLFVEGPLT